MQSQDREGASKEVLVKSLHPLMELNLMYKAATIQIDDVITLSRLSS